MVRVRVKKQNLLQKPWISPKFKMARSGQGRQRLKASFLLDKARKKLFLPSAKIRYLLDCCQKDTCLVITRAGIGMGHPRFFLSSLTRAILVLLLSPLFHHWCHPGASASSSLPSLAPPNCLCFFFSSVTCATQMLLLLLLFHHWCHSDLPSHCQSKIEGVYHPRVSLYGLFLFSFLVSL